MIMPGFDGFEVLARTRSIPIAAVIFVTAHSDCALRAFENNAGALTHSSALVRLLEHGPAELGIAPW